MPPEPLTMERYVVFVPRSEVVPAHLTVGADWPIYNAPRPLCGTVTWERTGCGAGRFFAAIDPADPYAPAFTRRCAQDDAFLLVFATQEEVETWARAYCQSCGVDPDEYAADEFARYARQSYRQHVGHTPHVVG
ncbi:MAG: hypothetical protein KKA73_07830 [Chloroflexi bacterium]|nr:hypothetical protein [Chloroflexota bacterium]